MTIPIKDTILTWIGRGALVLAAGALSFTAYQFWQIKDTMQTVIVKQEAQEKARLKSEETIKEHIDLQIENLEKQMRDDKEDLVRLIGVMAVK